MESVSKDAPGEKNPEAEDIRLDVAWDDDTDSSTAVSQDCGSFLVGTFYDLKQTKNGEPTGIANAQNVVNTDASLTVINEFMTENHWNPGTLDYYYQSPEKLHASGFCIPSCKASYAPVAYRCEDKVKPTGWVAVYRGTVKAPKTGKFRFVGMGDDCVVVRFNNDIVLEAGYMIPGLGKTAAECRVAGKCSNSGDFKRWKKMIRNGDSIHRGYEFFPHPDTKVWNDKVGGLMAGKEIDVIEGKSYPIEILLADISGDDFGAVLLIQDTSYGKSLNPAKLEFFRTNFSQPDTADLRKEIGSHAHPDRPIKVPAYDPDSYIWMAFP